MKKKTIFIHPHIRAAISNLNLDLGSELYRYEEYLSANSNNDYSATNRNDSNSAIATLEKPVATLHQTTKGNNNVVSLPPLEQNQVITEVEDVDSIPVASRVTNKPKSLLDTLLTPWGIFGLILFFGANALVLVGRDLRQNSTASVGLPDESDNKSIEEEAQAVEEDTEVAQQDSQLIEQQTQVVIEDEPIETESSQLNDAPQTNDILASAITDTQISPTNTPQQQLDLPLVTAKPPSPPMPLADIENKGIIHKNVKVPYANFKTALLTEAENHYQRQLPPPPAITPLASAVELTTPVQASNPPVEENFAFNNNSSSVNGNFRNQPTSSQQNTLSSIQTTSTDSVKPVVQTEVKHYIVTKYKNIDNYTRIKSIIPKALIMNIDREIVIQLGTFANKEAAQEYSHKMNIQGITTEIVAITE